MKIDEAFDNTTSTLAICIEHVTKEYQSHGVIVKALNDIDFSMIAGTKLCLVGRSGSGKTTLSRIIYGQERPSSGSALLFGKDPAYSYAKNRKQHCRTIQYVQQNAYLSFDPSYTILNSLSCPLRVYRSELSKRQRVDAIHQMLCDYELSELIEMLNRRPSELSGGQLQKFALMRAVLVQPSMLIADEPTAMLDIISTKEVAKIINRVPKATTVLCISHSKTFSDAFAAPIVEISNGRITYK